MRTLMDFDQAWPILQEEAINKLVENLELEGESNKTPFTGEEYMRFYTIVYDVCSTCYYPTVRKMYDYYKKTFEDYISSKVLPSLIIRDGEDLLRELLRRWNNHKIMTTWLSRVFCYLQNYFIRAYNLPSLEETSDSIFFNLVYREMNNRVRDAIVSLVNREREDEFIDRDMLKGIVDIYKEMAEKSEFEPFARDVKESILRATSAYCSRKAGEWVSSLPYEDYVLKFEQLWKQEQSRVSHYLTFITSQRVSEVVQRALHVQASKMEEMKRGFNQLSLE